MSTHLLESNTFESAGSVGDGMKRSRRSVDKLEKAGRSFRRRWIEHHILVSECF